MPIPFFVRSCIYYSTSTPKLKIKSRRLCYRSVLILNKDAALNYQNRENDKEFREDQQRKNFLHADLPGFSQFFLTWSGRSRIELLIFDCLSRQLARVLNCHSRRGCGERPDINRELNLRRNCIESNGVSTVIADAAQDGLRTSLSFLQCRQ